MIRIKYLYKNNKYHFVIQFSDSYRSYLSNLTYSDMYLDGEILDYEN